MIYEEGVVFKLMTDMSIDIDEFSRRLESAMDDYRGLSKNNKGPQTKRLQKIFELATKYAEKLNLREVEEENLITAILNSGFSTAMRILSIRISNIKSLILNGTKNNNNLKPKNIKITSLTKLFSSFENGLSERRETNKKKLSFLNKNNTCNTTREEQSHKMPKISARSILI